jgi:hypothetical protein
VLVYLQAESLNDHYGDWRICVLIEDCSSDCGTTCSGHVIIGFSKAHLYINPFSDQLPPLGVGRQTTMIESSTKPNPYVVPDPDIQEMLQSIRDTIRAVNLRSGRYRLDANLETWVNFSNFLDAYRSEYAEVPKWKD